LRRTTDLGTISVEQGRFVEGRVTSASAIRRQRHGRGRRQLFGDGKSITAAIGEGRERMGSGGRPQPRRTLQDLGLDGSKQVIAAEQPEIGRAQAVTLPASRSRPRSTWCCGSAASPERSRSAVPAAGTQVMATAAPRRSRP
jgi:hypothetical protein